MRRRLQIESFRSRRQRGQAAMEYALIFAGLIAPLTFALIFTAQLLWVWHSVADFTREGARYAATHCYQPGGGNVINFMRTNTPVMPDRAQFISGQAEIVVDYFGRDPETGEVTEFACEGAECSRECVPDLVRVSIPNYQFTSFMSYLGLPPVPIPNFQTSLPMESAGCSPDSEGCEE